MPDFRIFALENSKAKQAQRRAIGGFPGVFHNSGEGWTTASGAAAVRTPHSAFVVIRGINHLAPRGRSDRQIGLK